MTTSDHLQQHQLQWTVDDRFTTDVGRCTCQWRCWSPQKQEIREAHTHHLAFVQRQRDEACEAWKHRVADLHTIKWTSGGIACTGCDWRLSALGTSSAQQIVAFHHHVQDIIERST